MKSRLVLVVAALVSCGALSAQEMNPTQTNRWPQNQQGQPQGRTENGVPIYKITVVGRNIPAINYFHRSGWTHIGFAGTSLLPQGKGTAEVNSESGRTVIKAQFQGLVPANSFGVEYLTYVLWAITPEGRPVNLGEVLWSHGKADTTVTTNLQSFGLILTAEPYFAVTMPSDVVVMQNFVLPNKTEGVLETVDAHYDLLPRGVYEQDTEGQHTVLHPIDRKDRSPLELYEAINAVQIAEADGADKWAPDGMAAAKQDLQNAQEMDLHQKEMKQEITMAREAVQNAEDARIETIRKVRDADEAREKAEAEAAQKQAQQSALEAQQAQLQQQQAEQAAEQAKLQQEQAEQQAEQAKLQQEEAQAAAAKAQAQQAAAQQAAAQAQQQTEQMRERLREQLSQVLQTQETARGIIVNMSDVLFGFNKYDLKPDAQVKLAKVSGILLTYPNLKLQVEGYTDNVGSEQYNQKLSEERADAVQAFLISQGVQPGNITAQGLGEADPVADNSSAAGRAKNRRVELVVSGQAIGVQEQAPTQSNNTPVGPNGQPQAAPPPQAPQQPAPPQNPTGVSNPPQ